MHLITNQCGAFCNRCCFLCRAIFNAYTIFDAQQRQHANWFGRLAVRDLNCNLKFTPDGVQLYFVIYPVCESVKVKLTVHVLAYHRANTVSWQFFFSFMHVYNNDHKSDATSIFFFILNFGAAKQWVGFGWLGRATNRKIRWPVYSGQKIPFVFYYKFDAAIMGRYHIRKITSKRSTSTCSYWLLCWILVSRRCFAHYVQVTKNYILFWNGAKKALPSTNIINRHYKSIHSYIMSLFVHKLFYMHLKRYRKQASGGSWKVSLYKLMYERRHHKNFIT